MIHASEAGHYYWPDGRPAYQVPGSKPDILVSPDIRHARKLGLLPSVTGIIKLAAAPGLERWKADQLMMAALTLPRLPNEPESTWIARVRIDAQEQAKNAAERGTAIHKAIQERDRDGEYGKHVIGVGTAINSLFGRFGLFTWTAERSFAHPLGFGGKVDDHTDGIILDYKTKEFSPDTKLETYDEHAQQLAAYRIGLGMPQARCAIVYVSVTVPGLAQVIEIDEDKLKRGWACFTALLAYYKAKTGYDPTKVAT